jgi:PIN domain nuclease of toxin-antitoxin system
LKALLDTHVLLWWLSSVPRLSPQQEEVLRGASEEEPLWVSDITLWEIATLSSLGRIKLHLPLREWLEQATAPPLVQRLPISPAVAAEVAALPDSFHRDPADRGQADRRGRDRPNLILKGEAGGSLRRPQCTCPF